MNRSLRDNQSGFTLLELLVVLVVLILSCVGAYYVLQPADYSLGERDAKRLVSTAQIMRGLTDYYADNGQLPTSISDKLKVIGSDKDAANICNDLVPKYMKDIPLDPSWGIETVKGACNAKSQQYITSFLVYTTNDGKTLHVNAPMAESMVIQLTRQLP